MATDFEQVLNAPSFSLLELKEKKIFKVINDADDLYRYVNNFLPNKFTTNHGKRTNNEEESENEDLNENENQLTPTEGKTSRAKTIEELHKRIEVLRGKKSNYKEKLLKKGLKNRLKKKQRLEERKQLKKSLKKLEKIKSEEVNSEKKDNIQQVVKIEDEPKESNLMFNKFRLSESDNNKKQKGDPKSLLAKLEKKKLKLQKLEIKGEKEKLSEIKTKETWDAAIQKAEGIKLKDNVELLKKSVEKIKQRKNKSRKKWEEREKQVKLKKEEVQKKRQENIAKKRTERRKKRTKMLVKKGRILPK